MKKAQKNKKTTKKTKLEIQIMELEDRLSPGGKSCFNVGQSYIPGKSIPISGAEC